MGDAPPIRKDIAVMAKSNAVSPVDAVVTALDQSVPVSGNVVEDLFNRAYAVNEVKDKVFELRNGIRESLRNLATAGILNDEQRAELDEIYPPRERKGKDDEAEAESEPVAA